MRAPWIIALSVAAIPVAAVGLATTSTHDGPRLGYEDPQMYSTTMASPSEVRLDFKDDLDPAGTHVTVKNSKGIPVSLVESGISPTDERLLTVGLQRLTTDTYTVEWEATEAGTHHTSKGSYHFAVVD